MAHTYKVLNLVQQTQFHLLDAETERRGYLLTDGEDYLTSYGRAMSSVRNDIDQLMELSPTTTRGSKPTSRPCRNSSSTGWASTRTK